MAGAVPPTWAAAERPRSCQRKRVTAGPCRVAEAMEGPKDWPAPQVIHMGLGCVLYNGRQRSRFIRLILVVILITRGAHCRDARAESVEVLNRDGANEGASAGTPRFRLSPLLAKPLFLSQ